MNQANGLPVPLETDKCVHAHTAPGTLPSQFGKCPQVPTEMVMEPLTAAGEKQPHPEGQMTASSCLEMGLLLWYPEGWGGSRADLTQCAAIITQHLPTLPSSWHLVGPPKVPSAPGLHLL